MADSEEVEVVIEEADSVVDLEVVVMVIAVEAVDFVVDLEEAVMVTEVVALEEDEVVVVVEA